MENRRSSSKSRLSRRRVLLAGAGGVFLAAGTTPAWLQKAFASGPASQAPPRLGTPHDATVVGQALKRARTSTKPLLVVVIPQVEEQRWERGEIFGALFNHGTPKQLAPLALVEVVCATLAEVRAAIPAVASSLPTTEPLAMLVESDGTNTVTSINDTLPAKATRAATGSWDAQQATVDAALDARIKKLGELLDHATFGASGAVARWAQRSNASAGAKLIADFNAGRDLVAADVDGSAAALANHVQRASDADRTRALNQLGAAAAVRLTKRRVDGSYWAGGAGCGVTVEGGPDSAIGCGMGHVPDKARRFLYFAAPDYW